MTGVRTVEVAADDAEIRLDRWFQRHFPDLPHGRLERLLRTGQVRVDGARARASVRLSPGQLVRVPPLGARARPTQERPALDPADAARLRAMVLHIDDHVISLNKPPGLPVQGGSGVRRNLDAMLDALRYGAADRPRLVHRLDKDTGGVLLLGRSPGAAAKLTAAFRAKTTRKLYWALTVGVPKPPRGRIDLAVGKQRPGDDGGGRERVAAGADGAKRAITDYAVIEAAARRAAWVALMPLTGRTHQLRVHCAALGMPILGDGKYGGRGAFIDGVPGGKALMLHARAIALPHPAGGTLRIEAPLAESMMAVWRFFAFDVEHAPDPFAVADA